MIRAEDLHRAIVEYNQAYSDPSVWLKHANVDEDAFIALCDQFANAMIEFGMTQGAEEFHEVVATTIAAAMAVGVEVGRQYPATPFE